MKNKKLLIKILVTLFIFITYYLIFKNIYFEDKFLKNIIIFILNLFCVFLGNLILNDESYICKKLNFSNDDNNYYKGYLDAMIEYLTLSNKYMSKFKSEKNLYYLEKINCINNQLAAINPPNKYVKFHEDVLLELDMFLLEMNKS